MNILIDATNIIQGGGVSHLLELLKVTDKDLLEKKGISRLFIAGVDEILEKIPERGFLSKIRMGNLQSNFFKRYFWKKRNFQKIIQSNNIDIVFNPGGAFFDKKIPYVTMCRNMLVFETEEANSFGFTLYRLKFILLRWFQSKSITNAVGTIFISKYAKDYITNNYKRIKIKSSRIIHHGISQRFKSEVREQLDISNYNSNKLFKILYVSITDPYKHHENVVKAISALQLKGFPIEYNIVGAEGKSHTKLLSLIGDNKNIKFLGKVPFEDIQLMYKESDLFIFASTCENMPNILIEAMTAGLPIACSQKLPMPEFLNDGAIYFNSLDISSIESALEKMINSANLRKEIAEKSKKYSSEFSWLRCADETFEFIVSCVKK